MCVVTFRLSCFVWKFQTRSSNRGSMRDDLRWCGCTIHNWRNVATHTVSSILFVFFFLLRDCFELWEKFQQFWIIGSFKSQIRLLHTHLPPSRMRERTTLEFDEAPPLLCARCAWFYRLSHRWSVACSGLTWSKCSRRIMSCSSKEIRSTSRLQFRFLISRQKCVNLRHLRKLVCYSQQKRVEEKYHLWL